MAGRRQCMVSSQQGCMSDCMLQEDGIRLLPFEQKLAPAMTATLMGQILQHYLRAKCAHWKQLARG